MPDEMTDRDHFNAVIGTWGWKWRVTEICPTTFHLRRKARAADARVDVVVTFDTTGTIVTGSLSLSTDLNANATKLDHLGQLLKWVKA
jgi:hypothetical protein